MYGKKGEAVLTVVLFLVLTALGFLALYNLDSSPAITGALIVGDNSTTFCNSHINESSVLVGNVSGCIGDGLIINASDVTLNCQNFWVVGTDAGGSQGIQALRANITNVTITNCYLRDFETGILLNNNASSNWTIENVTLESNRDGIGTTSVTTASGEHFINRTLINGSSRYGMLLDSNSAALMAVNLTNSTIVNSANYDLYLSELAATNAWNVSVYENAIEGRVFIAADVNGSVNIFNNRFFNVVELNSSSTTIYWNTSKRNQSNYLNGSTIGGNFYSAYTGNDTDDDGLGDDPYTILGTGVNSDPIPMMQVYQYVGSLLSGIFANSTYNATNLISSGSFHSARQNITFYNGSEGVPLAERQIVQFDTYFNQTANFSFLSFDFNATALVVNSSIVTGVSPQHTLFFNNSNNRNGITVCPSAQLLGEVHPTCNGGINLSTRNVTDGVRISGIRAVIEGTQYRVENVTGSGVALGTTANLTIWDETETDGSPYSGGTRFVGNNTRFFANYTDGNGTIIGGATCFIGYNDTLTTSAMELNSTALLYQANRTYSIASTFGWNVTCGADFYDGLFAEDSVLINSSVACGTITVNTNLTNNMTVAGSCFHFGADNLILDCNNYAINYSRDGSIGYGVNVTGYSNFSIRNCRIMEGYEGVSNTKHAIFLSSAENGSIINVTITSIGNASNAIHASLSNRTNISDLTSSVSGLGGIALRIANGNNWSVSSSQLSALDPAWVAVELIDSSGQTIEENNITLSGNAVAFWLNTTTGSTSPANILVNNNVTAVVNFTIFDTSAGSNTLIYNNSFGEIGWNSVNLTTNLTLQANNTIFLENNSLGLVNSPHSMSLNRSATLIFRGLAYAVTPQLLRGGQRCDNSSECNISDYNATAGRLAAVVNSFSNYTTQSEGDGPVTTFLTPAASANFSRQLIDFNATVEDPSLVSVVIFSFDNSTDVFESGGTMVPFNRTASNSSGTWNVSGLNATIFAEGANQMRVFANDSFGNLNDSALLTFFIDRTAPNVTNVSNDRLNFTTGGSPGSLREFNATIHDTSLPENLYVNFSFSNGSGAAFNLSAINSSGLWLAFVNLSGFGEGNHTLRIYANDSAGNLNSSEVAYFIVDNTAPVVAAVLRNRTNTSDNTPDIQFNVTDNVVANVSCTLYVGSPETTLNSNATNASTFTTTTTNLTFSHALADGAYAWQVNCTDAPGNVGASEVQTLSIDTIAPAVSFAVPANNTNYSSGTQDFNLTVTDATLQVDTVLLQFSNGSNAFNRTASNSSGTWNVSGLNVNILAEGGHTLTAFANDTINNLNSSVTLFISIDRTAPLVTLTSPGDGRNFSGNSSTNVNFSVWVNDATLPENLFVSFSFENASGAAFNLTPGNSSGNWSVLYNRSHFAEGNHTMRVYANDSTGNLNSSVNISFIFDATPPNVTIEIANRTNRTDTGPQIQFTVTDNVVANVSCTLYVDGASNATNATTFTSTATNLTFAVGSRNGLYNYQVNCTDNGGNVGASDIYQFGIDNTAPTSSFSVPANNSNYTGSEMVDFNVTVSDATLGISAVLLQFSNGSNPFNLSPSNVSGNVWNYTFLISKVAEASTANQTVTLFVNDTLNNMDSSQTLLVRYDNTDPAVSVTCDPGTASVGQTVTCTCTSSDGGVGIASTFFQGGAGGTSEATTASGSGSFDSSVCEARDHARNNATAQGSWTVSAEDESGGGNSGGGGGREGGDDDEEEDLGGGEDEQEGEIGRELTGTGQAEEDLEDASGELAEGRIFAGRQPLLGKAFATLGGITGSSSRTPLLMTVMLGMLAMGAGLGIIKLHNSMRDRLQPLEGWVEELQRAGYSDQELHQEIAKSSHWSAEHLAAVQRRRAALKAIMERYNLKPEQAQELKEYLLRMMRKGKAGEAVRELAAAGWNESLVREVVEAYRQR